jgi:hypothetical protein
LMSSNLKSASQHSYALSPSRAMQRSDKAASAFRRREGSGVKRLIRLWLNGSSFGGMVLLLCSGSSESDDDAEHDHIAALSLPLLSLFVAIFCFGNAPCSNITCCEIGMLIAIAAARPQSVSIPLCLYLSVCVCVSFSRILFHKILVC